MKTQRGLLLIEPMLLMGMFTSFNMTNPVLGALMIGLSLMALTVPKPARDQA